MRKLILLALTVLLCSSVGLFSTPAAASHCFNNGNCVTHCATDPCGHVCCFETCCGDCCIQLDCAPPPPCDSGPEN